MSGTTNVIASTISIKDLIAHHKLAVNINQAANAQAQDVGKLAWANPADLLIPLDVQRELNTAHAMKIALGFEFRNMKPATGFRDPVSGKILITDGQHTVTGAALCSIPLVPVYVHDLPAGITAEEALSMQSKVFLRINRSNKPVNLYTIYKNELIQKDPGHLNLAAMCAKVGVTPCLNHNNRAGAVSHIKNLNTSWFQIGEQETEDALKFMRKYFPTEPIYGAMLVGLTLFIKKMNNYQARNKADAVWDPTLLATALSKNGTLKLKEIYEELHELNRNIGHYGASSTTQQWVAGMIRETYNEYIRTNGLSQIQLGRYC